MAKGAVGLDIGSRTVHVAQVQGGRGGRVVTNFGGVALPDHAVREGEILDPAAVGESIKQLVKAAKLKEKKVRLGVANQRVVVRQVELPWMDEAELRSSLGFQVQEFIPIPVEDAELDFHVLDTYTNDAGGQMLRMLLVAAHKDMVGSHLAAVEAAGLKPVGIDLNPFAILRTIHADTTMQSGPEVVIDIGAGVTDIIVHHAGVPKFVRILVLGGDDITDALMGGMSLERHTAEEMKQQIGADGSGPDPTAGQIVADQARSFIDEIRSSLDFYRAQVGGDPLAKVSVTGGGALLRGLPEALGDALRLPVELGNPFDRMQVKGTAYTPEQLAQVGPTLTTAVGLALGGVE